jgi:CDP-diacylglycerol--serine O-phosphatidyltransferase
MTFCRFWATA